MREENISKMPLPITTKSKCICQALWSNIGRFSTRKATDYWPWQKICRWLSTPAQDHGFLALAGSKSSSCCCCLTSIRRGRRDGVQKTINHRIPFGGQSRQLVSISHLDLREVTSTLQTYSTLLWKRMTSQLHGWQSSTFEKQQYRSFVIFGWL